MFMLMLKHGGKQELKRDGFNLKMLTNAVKEFVFHGFLFCCKQFYKPLRVDYSQKKV